MSRLFVSGGRRKGDVATLVAFGYILQTMPRGPRLDAPGVCHHVMARGIERQWLFRDDQDRDDFVSRLAALAQEGAVRVYAWVLLPTHFHLLVRTAQRSLAHTMRSLLTGYAGSFNRRHRRSGHLFQNRYKSLVCEEEPYLLELVRYLHLNPLRAGVVSDLEELGRYAYSGHAVLLGTRRHPWQATAEILGRFGADLRRARQRYLAFLAEGVGQGRRPEFQGGGLVRSAGGWTAVQELRRGRESYQGDERILGSSEFVARVLREVEKEGAKQAQGRWRALTVATVLERVCQVADRAGVADCDHLRSRKVCRSWPRSSEVYRTGICLSPRSWAKASRFIPAKRQALA